MADETIVSAINELRELLKNAVPSSKSGDTVPARFGVSAPMGGTTLTLPSRCSWAALISTAAFTFGFSSAPSHSLIPVAANTLTQLSGNGPLDLSTLHVAVLAAASGATITAWVQKAPDLA